VEGFDMMVEAAPGGAREILVVLAFALTGLLLAALAVFSPWPARSTGGGRSSVVEMHAPGGVPNRAELAAPGRR
jgi:hypothetical protein